MSQKPTYEELKQRIKELEKRDINQKKTEEELRESEKLYRLLADNVTDLIWTMDMEMNYTYFSPSVTSMSGYSVEEAMAQSVEESMTPASYDIAVKAIAEELELHNKGQRPQDRSRKMELELRCKDGSTIWAEIKAKFVYGTDGQPQSIIGVTRDITDRKRAEDELIKYRDHLEDLVRDRTAELAQSNRLLQDDIAERKRVEASLKESEEKYRNILDSMFDGYTETDLSGRYVYMNRAAYEYMGYTKEEYLGRDYKQTMTPETAKKVFEIFNNVYKTGKPAKLVEYEVYTKDRSVLHVEAHVTLMRDQSGKPNGFRNFSRVINERKQAEEEKKKIESQLHQAQKMEAIGTLAGGVAHDFSNLLMAIIGYADLALMKTNKENPFQEELEEIISASERASSLTRQLLAFSRKQVIQPKVLNLNRLLTDIKKMIGRLIGEDIEVLMIQEPSLWHVEIDPGQMEQVIMNLAVNSRDAMPKGGKLVIETKNVELDEKYFLNQGVEEKPGLYVMMAVKDSGIGIDKEIQQRIFEPFYTTKEINKGTGLGLSTVYGIIKQNQGFIWVDSEPGYGSTFKIYLPKIERNEWIKEQGGTPIDELSGSETILIAEDDDSLRKLLRSTLKKYGYKVLDAGNGEEAIEICNSYDGLIQLMITDVVMPKMNGKEAVDRIHLLYPQLKVIFMSGYTDETISHHGVLDPGLNFIEKPFKPEKLARKIREVLDD